MPTGAKGGVATPPSKQSRAGASSSSAARSGGRRGGGGEAAAGRGEALPPASALPPPGGGLERQASNVALASCVRAAKGFLANASSPSGPPQGWAPKVETPLLGSWLHGAEPGYLGKGGGTGGGSGATAGAAGGAGGGGRGGGGGGASAAEEEASAAALATSAAIAREAAAKPVDDDRAWAAVEEDYAFGVCESALQPGVMLPAFGTWPPPGPAGPHGTAPGGGGGGGGGGGYAAAAGGGGGLAAGGMAFLYREPSQPKHVLLQVHVGRRPPQYVRHPGNLPSLRTRLASLLGYNENTLRVSAEIDKGEERLPPSANAPRLMAVRVSGRPYQSPTDLLFLAVAWVNLVAAAAFCLLSLSRAPSPYRYASFLLPATFLYLSASSVNTAIRSEYLINRPLREVLGRRSLEAWLLVGLAMFGCDTTLMIAHTTLMPRGVKLSDECSNALRLAASWIAPISLDLPLLAINYLWHKRTADPYDALSLLMLCLSSFSVVVHAPYRLSRLLAAQRRQAERREAEGFGDTTEGMGALGEGGNFGWKEPTAEEMPTARRGVGFSEAPRPERPVSPMRMQLRRSQSTATEAIMAQLLAKREALEQARYEALQAAGGEGAEGEDEEDEEDMMEAGRSGYTA